MESTGFRSGRRRNPVSLTIDRISTEEEVAMSIRALANKNPAIIIAGIVLCLGICGWSVVRTVAPSRPGQELYFTNDDGKTWFADRWDRATPFDKDGKEAVCAAVYDCNGKQFVAYVTRLTPDSIKKAAQNGGKLQQASTANPPLRKEYKKPGDTRWRDIEGNFAEMQRYLTIDCANGPAMQELP